MPTDVDNHSRGKLCWLTECNSWIQIIGSVKTYQHCHVLLYESVLTRNFANMMYNPYAAQFNMKNTWFSLALIFAGRSKDVKVLVRICWRGCACGSCPQRHAIKYTCVVSYVL